jgi:hypothetical protein
MKYLHFLLVTVFCVLLSSAGATAQKEEGFVSLFNGMDLHNWVNVNCAPETWTVRDQMIICSGIPKGVMRTDRQYENYILELEFRHMKKGGNAGLFVHSDALTHIGKPFTRSIEIQIMDGNHGDVFAIQGATLTPTNSDLEKAWMRSYPTAERLNPAGEWNHYRVESRDGMLTLSVNGQVVTRAYHTNPRKGYICLESEGSEIYFRNIRIKELPGTNPPAEVSGTADKGFHALYNGLDTRGWKQVEGNKGHWQAMDYILDYDGKSTAEGEDKHLWTEKEYGNFILMVDWRQPDAPVPEEVPVILPNGEQARDENGKEITVSVLDAGDSGIYLRGSSKCQVNIWNWPVGSGEIWGYRVDKDLPEEVRRAATPMLCADNAPGEWNRFIITAIDDKVTVELNGKTVIKEARLPGMPEKGAIALQHHGDHIQFANIYIKEL